jgi:aspartate ammonia-lyase
VGATRTEHDFLGEKQIPAAAYWGVHTARAVENFPISGTRISAMPDLIRALGFVKKPPRAPTSNWARWTPNAPPSSWRPATT